mgnify:CR=1 FL=1
MTEFQNSFKKGLKDGLPIALGYLSVSFTFGMMAVEGGLPVFTAGGFFFSPLFFKKEQPLF